MDEAFDYVIAGGGSAGCVLAARLSEDPATRVCLVEAGGEGRDLLIRAPALTSLMLPGRPRLHNWAYRTVPQPGLNGRQGYQPRGRALGGCSAINAMIYVRGHPQDYDTWAAMGAGGWGWESVLPWFRRAESFMDAARRTGGADGAGEAETGGEGNGRGEGGAGDGHGTDRLRGTAGPLHVTSQRHPRPISRAFVAAARACRIAETPDFNGARQEGAGLYQFTRFHSGPHRGERCSAAAAWLHPAMARPNLTVLTRTRALRITLEGGRATGLVVRRHGRDRTLGALREVIVAQGVFGSPQLLMLSGIGPGKALRANGIAVAADLPGVGANLSDHLDYGIIHHSLRHDGVGLNPRALGRLLRAGLRWRKSGEGLFASSMVEAGAFLRSSPGLARPDLQVHFIPGIVDDHLRRPHMADGFTAHVCHLLPRSRGSVGLVSPDPFAPPRIDPGFLSDPGDLAPLMAGARMLERILEAPPLAPWRGRRLYPHDGSDEALEADIRARADSIYHPTGTCRMGSDPGAVTDPALCVRGVGALRVVDASVMPCPVSGNTNAAVLMIAERAAAMIRAGG